MELERLGVRRVQKRATKVELALGLCAIGTGMGVPTAKFAKTKTSAHVSTPALIL
jgi:hypothetical protein